MQHANHSANTRAHTTATTTEADTPTPTKSRQEIEKEFTCLYLQASDKDRALVKRLLLAVANNDIQALKELLADSPGKCAPVINSCINDITGGEA